VTSDAVLARIARKAVVISAIFAAAALMAGGVNAAVGVVGGASLTLMSFLLLRRGTARLADPGAPSGRRGSAMWLVLTRYALLALAAYVMVARLRLHPIGLLAGASSMVAALAIEAVSRRR
jgi:hypothetical protein